ncbi:MAG: plasmid pRiA4b ORF-3 family protein [Chitinophagales bacterium]|nr:plasmid pRiA4b ORF-3 family protein [Chitinophagales bacterium]
MAILKFRIYLEEDDAVYRDIAIKHTQTFVHLHYTILKAYDFDSKHAATFFRSNDNWQRGREITFEKYDKTYAVPPLFMEETPIGNEIKNTNQKFIYVYDFEKNWTFLVELINISKEENPKLDYPVITRKEGNGPQQYGIKNLLGDKFLDIEEKYDLTETIAGYGEEGEDDDNDIEENYDENSDDEL